LHSAAAAVVVEIFEYSFEDHWILQAMAMRMDFDRKHKVRCDCDELAKHNSCENGKKNRKVNENRCTT
jgi:hypothetical protein